MELSTGQSLADLINAWWKQEKLRERFRYRKKFNPPATEQADTVEEKTDASNKQSGRAN